MFLRQRTGTAANLSVWRRKFESRISIRMYYFEPPKPRVEFQTPPLLRPKQRSDWFRGVRLFRPQPLGWFQIKFKLNPEVRTPAPNSEFNNLGVDFLGGTKPRHSNPSPVSWNTRLDPGAPRAVASFYTRPFRVFLKGYSVPPKQPGLVLPQTKLPH